MRWTKEQFAEWCRKKNRQNPDFDPKTYKGTLTGYDMRLAAQGGESVPDRPIAERGDCSGQAQTLNKTETRFRDILRSRQYNPIWEQAITLKLNPPFKSYKPDLAYMRGTALTFVEVKGPHRFRERGIAKAALAAKTYPQLTFILADWNGKEWKESVLSP